MKRLCQILSILVSCGLLASCGAGNPDNDAAEPGERDAQVVRLLTHDSFAATEEVLTEFTRQSGIKIEVVPSGDAGEVVNKSVLTKGKPLGDVLYGVDNTFLSRALNEGVFVPYESPELSGIAPEFQLDPEHRVTPIDHSEVCINLDSEAFASTAPGAPASLEDLVKPAYKDQLVVQNPATSSPGLAFLLATIERFGDPGWENYWAELKANGVEVTSGWDEAYNGSFSGGAGAGDRPIVVSYASSPPAEVHFSEDEDAQPTTSVLEDGCFRQIEFAGILEGSENINAAEKVIDFLLSKEFQEDMPLNMFVFPVLESAELPEVFVDHAARPTDPIEMDPARIDTNREQWVERWTEIVLN